MGGHIWLLNATPYLWKLKVDKFHADYMADWKFPETIPAGLRVKAHFEWRSRGQSPKEGDVQAHYEMIGPNANFRIEAIGRHLQVKLLDFDTDNHSSGGVVPLKWKENEEISLTISGKHGQFSCNDPPTDWMQKNLATLGNRSLRQLCLPGSHDSGMSTRTGGTYFGTDDLTVTQTLSIKGQLNAGSRYFDIRPVITGGKWAIGHYTCLTKFGFRTWQGGNGEYLEDIVNDINEFTAVNHELIILDTSHGLNTDLGNQNYRTLTQDEWNSCMKLLSGIKDIFVLSDTSVTDLTTLPLKRFIENRAAVIVVSRPRGHLSRGSHARRGFFTGYEVAFTNSPPYQYSDDHPDPVKMSRSCVDSMRENRPNPTVHPTILGWLLPLNSTSAIGALIPATRSWVHNIVDLAVKCRPLLHSEVWPACTKETYPNIIQVDAFDKDVTTLAIAINKYFIQD